MATPLHPTHAHHDDEPHAHGTAGQYFLVFIALGILMLITVAAAKVDLPGIGPISGTAVNQIVALIIASIKACLVIHFFMGLKHGTPLIKLWAFAGFISLPVMFLILGDYFTRKYEPAPAWEPQTAAMRALPPSSNDWKPKPGGALERDIVKPANREPWVNLHGGGAGAGFFSGQMSAKE